MAWWDLICAGVKLRRDVPYYREMTFDPFEGWKIEGLIVEPHKDGNVRFIDRALRGNMKKAFVVAVICLAAIAAWGQELSDKLASAPGQYFSMKMQHLTEVLALSDDQQAKIKPIVEQETTNLTGLWRNPALSPKDKVKKLKGVVAASDQQIKPVLKADQLTKLQQLRTEQKQKADQWLAEQKAKAKKG
jgi:hypothetical protein